MRRADLSASIIWVADWSLGTGDEPWKALVRTVMSRVPPKSPHRLEHLVAGVVGGS